MKVVKLGNLINFERTKIGVSLEKLSMGLCSSTVLRRIEAGDREVDFFLIERLLSRLGSSINKMEILQDSADYELLLIREYIRRFLIQKNYRQAEIFLSEYEKRVERFRNIHEQYILVIKAVIAEEKEGDYALSGEYLERAMKLTLLGFELDRIDNYLLSEDELILIVFNLKNKEQTGKGYFSAYGRLLLHYVDKHFRDEEVKSCLYGRIAWVIGESLIKRGQYDEALEISLNAERRLTANGLLSNLPQLLDRIVFLSKGRNNTIHKDYRRMRDALRNLYKEHGYQWDRGEGKFPVSYRQRHISLISEVIRQERILRGYSQLKLSDYLDIDIKTISRIESGKAFPKTRTMEKLMRHFDLELEAIETRIVTNSLYLLELEREVAKLNSFKKYLEAEQVFLELKAKLSLYYKRNRQYVKYFDAIFDWILRKKNSVEILERLTDAFHITRGKFGILNLGEFHLSKVEAVIINNIAICYKEGGEIYKSIELLEKAVKSFENSKVDTRFYYIPLSLIYMNLCVCYEETDQYEKAIAFADKSICYAIDCMRGDFLGFLLEEKTYTRDRMQKKREHSKSLYRQSYQLRKLMKASEAQKEPLRKAFRSWYGEEIE